MPSRTFPLLAWGTADDISAGSWSNNGTPTVTPTTDPFGGSLAYNISDNDVGSAEARLKSTGALSGDVLVFTPCLKFGSASNSICEVRDSTDADYPMILTAAWSGGVPTITPTSTGGNPTPSVHGTVALGNGWYVVLASCPWTPDNVGRIELYATNGTVGNTGDTSYYLRHLLLLDLLGAPRAFRRPRRGYRADVAPSSLEDAWSYGDDYVLRGRASWVPSAARGTPYGVSGWYGQAENQGINAGLLAMLAAGWEKNVLTFVPDRATCTKANAAYLRAPAAEWDPQLEGNADYATDLELVSSTPFLGF